MNTCVWSSITYSQMYNAKRAAKSRNDTSILYSCSRNTFTLILLHISKKIYKNLRSTQTHIHTQTKRYTDWQTDRQTA